MGYKMQDIEKFKFDITRQDCVSIVDVNSTSPYTSDTKNELPFPIFPKFSYNALMAITPIPIINITSAPPAQHVLNLFHDHLPNEIMIEIMIEMNVQSILHQIMLLKILILLIQIYHNVTMNDDNFNIDHGHYCQVHSYLAKMIVKANGLNNKFQNCIKNIFGISNGNNRNLYKNILFQEASIQKLERCQNKAETDYFNSCPFPTTAAIFDMICCSLTFQSTNSVMDAIDLFIQQVDDNGKENNQIYIKKIVRGKNGFSKESANKFDRYIQFNVIVSDGKYRMIAEVFC